MHGWVRPGGWANRSTRGGRPAGFAAVGPTTKSQAKPEVSQRPSSRCERRGGRGEIRNRSSLQRGSCSKARPQPQAASTPYQTRAQAFGGPWTSRAIGSLELGALAGRPRRADLARSDAARWGCCKVKQGEICSCRMLRGKARRRVHRRDQRRRPAGGTKPSCGARAEPSPACFFRDDKHEVQARPPTRLCAASNVMIGWEWHGRQASWHQPIRSIFQRLLRSRRRAPAPRHGRGTRTLITLI